MKKHSLNGFTKTIKNSRALDILIENLKDGENLLENKVNMLLKSKETEMMVLGCMITNKKNLELGLCNLCQDDFYIEEHLAIFKSLKKLHKENIPTEVLLLCKELKKTNIPNVQSWAVYVTTLAQYVGTSAHFEYYLDELIGSATKRNLHELLFQYSNKSIAEIKDILTKKCESAASRQQSIDSLYRHLLQPASEQDVIDEIRNRSPGMEVGLKIGNRDCQLPGGAITILAAPTSHGKTTFLINLALGVLKNNIGKSIYFFSYEENRAAIISLFLNAFIEHEISKNNRRSIESFFREGNLAHIQEGSRKLFCSKKEEFFKNFINSGKLNVFYEVMSAEQLSQAVRYLKKNREDIGAVFIDYMQLLSLVDAGRLSRQEQLKRICLLLKDCAVETGLPLVIAAQFNRQVTCEADLSPINISEAGDIERIASLILGLWNRNFLGFRREGNATKNGETITIRKPEIYVEVLKGRIVESGHSDVLHYNGNMGVIKNFFTNSIPSLSLNQIMEV